MSEPRSLTSNAVPAAQKLGVTTRHGDVVEKDVGLGMTPDGGQVGVKQETGTDVGAAAHDEQCRTRRQRADGVVLLAVTSPSSAATCAANPPVNVIVCVVLRRLVTCAALRR